MRVEKTQGFKPRTSELLGRSANLLFHNVALHIYWNSILNIQYKSKKKPKKTSYHFTITYDKLLHSKMHTHIQVQAQS